jgi:mono/diheme cytochrome c family protein
MKQLCIATAVGTALVIAPVLGYAQMAVDIGKREYALSCTVCHGDRGKGDGPLVEYLKKTPTDLTKIQKNNGGVFPFDRLYNAIDGREAVRAHGPREMPVWGKEYSDDAAELTSGFGIAPKDRESFVRGRIIALIGYIYTLQAK